MERRMRGNSHVRCGAGEKMEIMSKSYLLLYKSYELEMELAKKNNIEMLNLVKEISNLADIYYIRQKETKGLGHAIYCAKHFVGNEAFAVMLGDDIIYSQKPVIKQLIECYEEYKTSIVGVQEVPLNKVNKYGIINGVHIENNVYKVKDLVEKPDEKDTPSNIAILGRYIITPQIFDVLVHTKPGKNGEIQLTDALKSIILREAVHAYKFEGKRYDVGDKLEFLAANIEFALKNMELTSAFEDYLLSLASKLQHKKTM